MKDRKAQLLRACLVGFVSLLLSSCAADGNYRPIPPGEGPATPRYVDLRDKPQIATFHFPRGRYSLEAEDDVGYYYRAPRQLIKHSFAGFDPYEGGLFVRKDDPRKIRGYVVWAGGRTKIGNLSGTDHEFEPPPAIPQTWEPYQDPTRAE